MRHISRLATLSCGGYITLRICPLLMLFEISGVLYLVVTPWTHISRAMYLILLSNSLDCIPVRDGSITLVELTSMGFWIKVLIVSFLTVC